MAVSGYASAQDVEDINIGTIALAQAMGTAVGLRVRKDANLSDLVSIPAAKVNLGLDLVNNTPDLEKPLSYEAIAALATKITGPISAASVGLGNVTNTSDADKPVSTAQLAALNLKVNTTTYTSGLALKADTTALTSGLALKADVTALTSGLALKVDTTTYTTDMAAKAPSASPTFTGVIRYDGAAGTPKQLDARTGTSRRWITNMGDGTAEAGANAGSNYTIIRYDDTGASLGTAFSLNRATGQAGFSTRPQWGATPWDSTNLALTSAAAFVGALSDDGVTPTTVQKHIVRTYVNDISGVTMGAASTAQATANTTAINAYLATATKPLSMRGGDQLRPGGTLVFPSNTGIVCDHANQPTIFMPAANFTNTVDRGYGTSAVGLKFDGLNSGAYTPGNQQHLEGVIVQAEATDNGRYLRGIVAQNVTNLNMDVEVFGIPMGVGITLSGVRGRSIINPYVHDMTSNFAYAGQRQISGIEIDNDHISPSNSYGIFFPYIKVNDITMGATLKALFGEQTDGITFSADDGGHTIAGYQFRNLSEAIDIQTRNCNFGPGTIKEARDAGIKLVHGAKYNTFSAFNMQDIGRWGVCLSGSPNAGAGHTEGNVFAGGVISNLNYQNAFISTATIGAVCLIDNSGGPNNWRPTKNTIGTLHINMGTNGIYGINDESSLGGNLIEPVNYQLNAVSGALILRETLASTKVRFGGETTYRTTNYSG